MKAYVAVFLASACFGQTESATTFEVASVKASPARTVPSGSVKLGCDGGPGTSTPKRFICTATSVESLIRRAWSLEPNQLAASGGGSSSMMTAPGTQWLPAGIDIAATIPDGATQEQVRTMLQNLLIERFKLAYHWDKKEMDAYALVVAKNGPKMKDVSDETPAPARDESIPLARSWNGKTDANGCPVYGVRGDVGPTLIVGPRMCAEAGEATMAQMAKFLTWVVGSPVTDATGLHGKYSFGLAFARETPPGVGWDDSRFLTTTGRELGSGATIFAALQDQLGLKLEKTRRSIDIFVIDDVEKTPTEN